MKIDIEYIGTIMKGILPNDIEGKYKVIIQELMPSGIVWAKNETVDDKFSRWIDLDNNKLYSAGTYKPLHPGMQVTVKFRNPSQTSGYISNIISYDPLIGSTKHRDSINILNKTKGGAWIYQDDYRDFTHILHGNGNSNIVLDDKSVSIQVGILKNGGSDGSVNVNGFEVSKTGTRFEYGNSSIVMDDTGIILKSGGTILSLTDSGVKLMSDAKIDIESKKNMRISGKKINMQGHDELTLYSNITRITGGTNMSLNGGVVSVESVYLTNINSSATTVIKGLIKTKINSPVVEVAADINLSLISPLTYIEGQALTLSGTSMVIDSSVILMDGPILHGMGAATGFAKTMGVMNLAVNKGIDLASAVVTTAGTLSDPVTAAVNGTMVKATCTGAAKPIGNINKPYQTRLNVGSGVSEKISYLLSSDLAAAKIIINPEDRMKMENLTHEL